MGSKGSKVNFGPVNWTAIKPPFTHLLQLSRFIKFTSIQMKLSPMSCFRSFCLS
ncbi:hypothetical protein PSHT_10203 [Puccinia striiformis]|uniref:Uncharacterized protein n=1 Tax=Puccinia striiformis TaxID=27350 RepID=A0A2S4VBC1_9BASI|nr:hypothetical protein PSHT_10203 [Puccinia striiformis]